ncbi:SMP-30/Gluconolaconase/LRE-like region-containing protein [Sphingobium chlorophenolicum L-1]|uniref:SMP-30/Gluconolaconase/LRE-like region-containing protein n=1 Tax=Sphingobium chlorophenolicum L-1 TaxID=690566 RepID=F6EY12_SPHCR|nr:SMP-30/gluconolactonase/LRE family protein [Sphingobium chlorophenolicum]AEG48294.1 SMP-30/Gluconolaconase/LRE-like region-containing protein [Sphingobium chlorophenolicum L-1]
MQSSASTPALGRREILLGGAGLALASCAPSAGIERTISPKPLALADFTLVRDNLDAPEGIASSPDGRLFVSNGGGAIGVLERDGMLRQMGKALAPNGVAVDREGRVIVANMGLLNQGPGPLQRIDVATGAIETLVSELEGRQLVASNGPATARNGDIYCTHSSWGPIGNIGTTTAAGFIYRVGPDGRASIVARGLRGVNGLCLDREERHVYASLTAEGRIRRWRREADGSLSDPQDYGPLLGVVVPNHQARDIRAMATAERADLGYCDGIAFDARGNLWVTLPFANRIVAITPDGRKVDIAHDPEGKMLSSPTNLCWGGADLRDLHVVSRASGVVVKARTNVAGLPLANWPLG